MILRLSAPGKLMISGEYVVLDGSEALVAAVDARLWASASAPGSDRSPGPHALSPGTASLPSEALLARQHAEASLGATDMDLMIDASALRSADKKLGLGSSAAASAAAAAAVVAWHGGDVRAARRDILGWALAGHRAIAPEGSGADVAAATLGGLVRFRRDAAEDAQTITWPDALQVEVVWTGTPARTSELVRKVRELADGDPRAYAEASSPLRDAAGALLDAIVRGHARDAVDAARDHGRAMQTLGERSGAGIVTAPLARAAQLAEAHGGSAKPSGAGGGDVALAFFADPASAASFRDACPDAGLTLLSLSVGADGVRLEDSPPPSEDPT